MGDDENRFSYIGRKFDEEINLYYVNARYYDATTGRFINVDPVQDGWNWYVYANDNPLKFTDPTGLKDYTGWFHADGFQNLYSEDVLTMRWDTTEKTKTIFRVEVGDYTIYGGPLRSDIDYIYVDGKVYKLNKYFFKNKITIDKNGMVKGHMY
ncbi:MAG: RHS repeat-associated core domain-containing protein [Spirochaetales bacterium]|nr:RHS repeat-associated core domain-containing protein [Spirochaetales bacterium]